MNKLFAFAHFWVPFECNCCRRRRRRRLSNILIVFRRQKNISKFGHRHHSSVLKLKLDQVFRFFKRRQNGKLKVTKFGRTM